ncbi:MAG: ATP-binding protein, partial [Microcystaceae cyanobacterium]
MLNRKFRPYFFLPLLILGGLLGNHFSLPLFFGVDFIFGSIFTLLIVYYYGLGWGAIAGIIISSYTVILWQHPYALIALAGEALFVAWRLRKHRDNLVLLVGIYWLLIGMPFIFLTYHFLLKMPIVATEL